MGKTVKKRSEERKRDKNATSAEEKSAAAGRQRCSMGQGGQDSIG